MKRLGFFVLLFQLVFSNAAFTDGRVDLGVDIPLGFSGLVEGGSFDEDASDFFREHIIPFPEAGVYYTRGTGPFNFGIGGRAFTFILESVAWPNAFAEFKLGPAVIQGQIGGGAFLLFGLYNSLETGAVFFPDLSAWFRIGKTFRLGGGMLGVFIDEVADDTVPLVFYLGGKAAIEF